MAAAAAFVDFLFHLAHSILVMRNNLFEWGDLYFLQLTGTAMGTSAACMWATIYFAVQEIITLIPMCNQSLIIFKCLIDDVFGIWICDEPDT